MSVHPLTNTMPGTQKRSRNIGPNTVESADVGSLKWAQAIYDFAVDGGAIGAIGLLGSLAIPSGAIIVGGHVEVLTPFTTGSAATLAIGVEGTGDIVAAAVVSGAPWSTAGIKSVIPAGTGATAVKTTAARDITATIAVGTITAGKAVVRLSYMDPTANS